MAVIQGNAHKPSVGGAGSFYPVTIDDSLRWPASGCQLFRTVGTPTDAKKHTHAFWVKVNPIGTAQTLNSVYGNASGYYSNSGINHDGRIIYAADYARYYYSTMKLRDPSAWVHILQVLDSTEASNSDRMKLYVNGVRQTSFTNFATVPLNWTGSYHATNGLGLRIGRTYTGAGFNSSLLSYTSEYIFVDGQALDPTDFGQFQDGVWIPDTYAGTYGNNGYKLDFSNPSNIGEDSSGNGNDFSVTVLAAHDAMPDSPTNNFCTLNPLAKGSGTITFSEGNLKSSTSASVAAAEHGATFTIPKSGKWYWEAAYTGANTGGSQAALMGIMDIDTQTVGLSGNHLTTTTGDYITYYTHNSSIYENNVLDSSFSGNEAAATVGFALDMDNGYLFVHLNGTYIGGTPNFSTGANHAAEPNTTRTWLPFFGANGGTTITWTANFGQDSTFAGATTAGGNTDKNGKGDFKYAVPSGFLALCTANLPTPAIVNGSEHFVPYLYTADNTSPKSRTGMGFSPDFLWFKDRTTAFSHGLYDTVRGIPYQLQANNTSAENSYNLLDSFDADGFTTTSDGTAGNVLNYNTDNYVTWAWKAGGTAVSNTSGSTTSNVSANTDAGFSIVTWFANAATGTVGHGLNSAPELVIAKPRDDSGTNWYVMHTGALTASQVFNLDVTGAAYTPGIAHFNSTYPTSSVISYGGFLGNALTYNNKVAYCFHSVEGYSKVGKYFGNGSADGPFVYTGFRPSFILIKKSSAAGDNWTIYDTARDPYNVAREYLIPNSSQTAASTDTYDILSNGFKIRTSGAWVNTSGATYAYLAFAETPFKYANAR